MPATPAWPPSSAPRLFVDQPLATGAAIALDGNPAHYLLNVMRLGDGDAVRLFDDRTGEWTATVLEHRKRSLVLGVADWLGERETVPDLWLCAAPVRRQRWEWVVEKATELGVARIVPVLTRRAVVDKVKPERLRAIAIEAAEQCGRTALPRIADAVALPVLLRDWPTDRQLLHADEAGGLANGRDGRPPRPRRHPDRAGRRLGGRGARPHRRHPPGVADHAWPPHPSRGNRRARRRRRLDGDGRRLDYLIRTRKRMVALE